MTFTGINQPVFGTNLDVIMSYQEKRFPNVSIPIIFILLKDTLIKLDAEHREGVFRIPGTQEEVDGYKQLFNQGKYSIYVECNPNTLAGMFKLFLRELPEPVIPVAFYDNFVDEDDVVTFENNPQLMVDLLEKIPEVHRCMFIYIIDFLQCLAEHEEETKMGVDNLAMVFSACILFNPDPVVALAKTETAKKCIATFIRHLPRTLIETVNTSIEGYEPGSGMEQLLQDPIQDIADAKEKEKKDKPKKKTSILRDRSRSQSKSSTLKRRSIQSPNLDVLNTSSESETPVSMISSSVNSKTSSHSRGVSVGSTDDQQLGSLKKKISSSDAPSFKLWDMHAPPPPLVRPNFCKSKLSTPR
ncbi:Rho-GAP domain-containing protein [Entamoeba marina]